MTSWTQAEVAAGVVLGEVLNVPAVGEIAGEGIVTRSQDVAQGDEGKMDFLNDI